MTSPAAGPIAAGSGKYVTNLTELRGFILEWTAEVMVDAGKAGGKPQWVKISFTNRDLRAGRRAIVFD